MKLLLEHWRKYLLTEASDDSPFPEPASVITVNPQDYVKWPTNLTNDLQSYIAFNLEEYLKVFDEEDGATGTPAEPGPVAQRAEEYFYSATNTAEGCKTATGEMAYQTSGITGAKGMGWTAYKIAAAMRAPAPIVAHRTGASTHQTSKAAQGTWMRFVHDGAKKIELTPECAEQGHPELNFALKLKGITLPNVTLELQKIPGGIEGLLAASAHMFNIRGGMRENYETPI